MLESSRFDHRTQAAHVPNIDSGSAGGHPSSSTGCTRQKAGSPAMAVRSETKLVTLKIDEQEVTVPAGTYILQAAESAGIDVPNLCYQPLLRPWGSCRLCTVEILGSRGGLIESCATPVREGMEVSTNSQS